MTGRLALLLGAGLLGSCGYALVGSGNALPPDVRAVAVPVFVNATERAGVEQWLSEAVAREMAARGGLRVPASIGEADAVLRGEVKSYSAWPAVVGSDGRATEYQIVVVCDIRLERPEGDEILSLENFRFQERYLVSTSSQAYSDLENLAVRELSSRFAESLVTALLEGF